MSYTTDEVHFLLDLDAEITAVAGAITRDHAMTKATAVKDAATFHKHFGANGRAAMELCASRTSAQGKLPHDWLMCHDSAQQATPLAVAQQRAHRIHRVCGSEAIVHDVTCSIGTEGAAITDLGMAYHGSDLDMSRLLMARQNVPNGLFFQADALKRASTSSDVIIADPARRAGGRRITKPDQLIPPLPQLVDHWRITTTTAAPMAIKCAPGLDFQEWDGLVSVVSVAGGVKEACLYTPELSEGLTREAIMIGPDQSVDVLNDRHGGEVPAGDPGTFIIDPDGAVVRAGLVQHYAARAQLWMLDEHIAYLTGDLIPQGRSGFRFIEMVGLKQLKSALVAHDAGSLEILVRGVDVDPDQLRKKLKLKGNTPMAVICTRIGRKGVALICHAREHSQI
ncbi:SAM-dependent methyltransferase [Corynebacterium diphtheriae]|nr:SAM-dependent methyltransferase [Corynebacterium diphtheriae]CAB1010782.1 SAM-dependent methyltransferase [Corynebacterium diphtheriae]